VVEPQSSQRVPVLLVVGCLLALIWGIVLAVAQTSILWFLVAVATVVANVAMFAFGRYRLRNPRALPTTGRVLSAQSDAAPRAHALWVGGANLPGGFGRMNATWPLATLELVGTQMTLLVRPRLVSRLFGVGRFSLSRDQVVELFPVRGRGLGGSGVGLQPVGAPVL
jgi:hypothetical protein